MKHIDKKEKLYLEQDDRSPLSREEREKIRIEYERNPMKFDSRFDVEKYRKPKNK